MLGSVPFFHELYSLEKIPKHTVIQSFKKLDEESKFCIGLNSPIRSKKTVSVSRNVVFEKK